MKKIIQKVHGTFHRPVDSCGWAKGGGGGRVIVLVLVLIRALSHVCRKYHALNKMSNNTRIWKLFG